MYVGGMGSDPPRKTPPHGNKRAPSIMGDDERASQPRPQHNAIPPYVDNEKTPPPILINSVGKPLDSGMHEAMVDLGRKRKTMQEFAEELWPARRAMPMLLEQLERLVALETEFESLKANGPAEVARTGIASLRTELIGHDGDAGMLGEMAKTIARDLSDHKKVVADVEERATKADKFIRKVITSAAAAVGGSVIAAVLLIYSAGEHAATSRAEVAASRLMMDHQIQQLNDSMTDLKVQVRMLIETRITH